MQALLVQIALNLAGATAAGALIGAERSYNGRSAGFRTHALVALAAAGAMLVCLQPTLLPAVFPPGAGRFDPTRICQGVMAGIGFLGAGVIFKEGVSVQGLTTAACIWATAAVGMLFGLGLLAPGAMLAAGVLFVLVVLRVVENELPRKTYVLATFTFRSAEAPSDDQLEDLLGRHAVRLLDISYSLLAEGALFQFRGNLTTPNEAALPQLAARLKDMPGLVDYDLARLSH